MGAWGLCDGDGQVVGDIRWPEGGIQKGRAVLHTCMFLLLC